MCLQCLAEAENLGEILPGIALMRAHRDAEGWGTGRLGLVIENDPFYVLLEEPYPDPTEGLSDEEINGLSEESWEQFCNWAEAAESFREAILLQPYKGWILVDACIKAGWVSETDGSVESWLFHRIGVFLRDSTAPSPA